MENRTYRPENSVNELAARFQQTGMAVSSKANSMFTVGAKTKDDFLTYKHNDPTLNEQALAVAHKATDLVELCTRHDGDPTTVDDIELPEPEIGELDTLCKAFHSDPSFSGTYPASFDDSYGNSEYTLAIHATSLSDYFVFLALAGVKLTHDSDYKPFAKILLEYHVNLGASSTRASMDEVQEVGRDRVPTILANTLRSIGSSILNSTSKKKRDLVKNRMNLLLWLKSFREFAEFMVELTAYQDELGNVTFIPSEPTPGVEYKFDERTLLRTTEATDGTGFWAVLSEPIYHEDASEAAHTGLKLSMYQPPTYVQNEHYTLLLTLKAACTPMYLAPAEVDALGINVGAKHFEDPTRDGLTASKAASECIRICRDIMKTHPNTKNVRVIEVDHVREIPRLAATAVASGRRPVSDASEVYIYKDGSYAQITSRHEDRTLVTRVETRLHTAFGYMYKHSLTTGELGDAIKSHGEKLEQNTVSNLPTNADTMALSPALEAMLSRSKTRLKRAVGPAGSTEAPEPDDGWIDAAVWSTAQIPHLFIATRGYPAALTGFIFDDSMRGAVMKTKPKELKTFRRIQRKVAGEAALANDAASAEAFMTTHRGAPNRAAAIRLAATIFGGLQGSIPAECSDAALRFMNYPGTKHVGCRTLDIAEMIQSADGELKSNARLRRSNAPAGSKMEPDALVILEMCLDANPSAQILLQHMGVNLHDMISLIRQNMPSRRDLLLNATFAQHLYLDNKWNEHAKFRTMVKPAVELGGAMKKYAVGSAAGMASLDSTCQDGSPADLKYGPTMLAVSNLEDVYLAKIAESVGAGALDKETVQKLTARFKSEMINRAHASSHGLREVMNVQWTDTGRRAAIAYEEAPDDAEDDAERPAAAASRPSARS